MRWQWPARIVVALIGVGAAIAIVVSSHRRARPPEPVTELQEINPNVVAKGGAGLTQYLKTGKNPVNLTSTGSEEDRTGRRFFTGVLIEGLDENRYSIKGDRLDLDGPADRPTTFNVSGHVVITTSDGLRLETDKASYDDTTGRLSMPGSVTYAKGRISGSALAATYDRDRDVITLLGDAKAHVDADTTGHGAADATATRMNLARGQHMLDLDESARIVGDSQVLTSTKATVTFTEDERAIKFLELRGAAHATPKAGAAGANQPEMAADNITMSFRPDGVTLQHASLTGQASLTLAGASARAIHASWIDLFMAPDGHTLTSLKANDRVDVNLAATETSRARSITAGSLVATGDDAHGLTSARFEGTPVFTEKPEPSRGAGAAPPAELRGSGTVLVLTLGGQLDAIEAAEFQQNAEFHSGDATASGDIAKYDQAHDVVHFLPNPREPRRKPRVTNPDISVDAWSIDLQTVSQDLAAAGEVTTQSRQQAASPGKSAAALFDSAKPVSGSAESLRYEKSTGIAAYRGGKTRAKLWQGASKIQADQIDYSDLDRNLRASGHVDSIWELEAASSPKPGAARGATPDVKTYTVQAETLVYDDAARLATFKASEVTLTTPDGGEIRSAVLTFRLAATSRTLDELHADRNAWAQLPGNYETVSDTLVYRAEPDLYVLRGKPNNLAQVKSPNQDAPKPAPGQPPAAPQCAVTTGLHIEIDRKNETVVQPGVSQAMRSNQQQPCSVPLKRGGK